MAFPDILPEYNELTGDQKMNILGIAVTDLRNKVDTFEKILVTGDPPTLPLPERVRTLEKFQDKFEYWSRIVGGALILNFLGFATGILIAVVRFLPVLEAIANKTP